MELELKRFERISSELDRFRIRGKLTDLIFVCRENDLSLGFVPAHQAMFSSISKSPCSIDERKKILALLKFRVAKW